METIVKIRKKHSTPSNDVALRRLGRPSKADRDRILRQPQHWIAREFGPRVMRQPVDVQFKPYYDRFLQGNLQAIVDYCDRNAPRLNDASFYELMGRLFFLQFYQGVKQVLSDIARSAATGWIKKRETYEYWYKRLLPLCQKARQFIEEAHASCPDAKRDKLWRDYILRPLPPVYYKHLAGLADEDRAGLSDHELQKEANDLDQERRRSAIEWFLAGAESLTEDSVRSYFRGLGCRGKQLEQMT